MALTPFGFVTDTNHVLHVAMHDATWRPPGADRLMPMRRKARKGDEAPVTPLCGTPAKLHGDAALTRDGVPHTVVCYRCRKVYESRGDEFPAAFEGDE